MFSANENLLLRQHKRRIVDWIEATLPESVLDAGTNIMVMQVNCQDPGCVPIETAIVVVFPHTNGATQLLEGLPESNSGGAFKTKILKPMDQVTHDDVLDALPPAFAGGRRTLQRLCRQARDVMMGQVMQLFANSDVEGRRLMAEYLQVCLQQFMDNDCQLPLEWEQDEQILEDSNGKESEKGTGKNIASKSSMDQTTTLMSGNDNIVLQRPMDDDAHRKTTHASSGEPSETDKAKDAQSVSSNSTRPLPPSDTNHAVSQQRRRRQQAAVETRLNSAINNSNNSSSLLLSRLSEREHMPGIRRPGCPCCDPDSPANAAAMMMQL